MDFRTVLTVWDVFVIYFHVVSIVLMTNVTVIWMYLYTAQDNKILYQDRQLLHDVIPGIMEV